MAQSATFGIGPFELANPLNDVCMWHIAAPDVCDGTSAVGENRHRIPGASVGQPTEPCLALPQAAEGAFLGPGPQLAGTSLGKG